MAALTGGGQAIFESFLENVPLEKGDFFMQLYTQESTSQAELAASFGLHYLAVAPGGNKGCIDCAQFFEDADLLGEATGGKPIAVIYVEPLLAEDDWISPLLKIFSEHVLCRDTVLLIGTPNAGNLFTAARLLDGRLSEEDRYCLRGFSEKALLDLLAACGFTCEEKSGLTFDRESERARLTASDSIFLSPGSDAFSFIEKLKAVSDQELYTEQFCWMCRPAAPCALKDKAVVSPFLSIVMRTQGTRPAKLAEVLLCLSAQTCTDFEVLLIGHKMDETGRQHTQALIERQPGWLQSRIRLIEVSYGNRTTPLNVGYTAAGGAYICTLDDDDLVTSDWVETFYDLANQNPGAILHCYGYAQPWREVALENGTVGLVSCGPVNSGYCIPFHMVDHLRVNHSPTTVYALPSYLFYQCGFRFNEDLTTNEDWELLMRAAFLCGVSDCDRRTSIYRLWNIDSSRAAHSPQEWEKNRQAVIGQLESERVLVTRPEQLLTDPPYKRYSARLYIDAGMGLSEKYSFESYCNMCGTFLRFAFSLEDLVVDLVSLRIDPGETGDIGVRSPHIILRYRDEREKIYAAADLESNGLFCCEKESFIFLQPDPQFFLSDIDDLGIPAEVEFTGHIFSLDEDHRQWAKSEMQKKEEIAQQEKDLSAILPSEYSEPIKEDPVESTHQKKGQKKGLRTFFRARTDRR
ncbi:Glycosyl transferase family 2 [Anaerotruncus sp. 2789STDY5834896]|uniref:Glycosyl transferase family 2 n=1 Tax=uncultured Anaerotruncus sp. TaxID=905011 RepID=A0A1C6KC17_9FIRM|nr:Glycosyl transferase family 2 [uncultured Anaerotruncus sp.]